MKKIVEKYRLTELDPILFRWLPKKIDFIGVDYDGRTVFGTSVNPRLSYASERWHGFKKLKECVSLGFTKLTSINRPVFVYDFAFGVDTFTFRDVLYNVKYSLVGGCIYVDFGEIVIPQNLINYIAGKTFTGELSETIRLFNYTKNEIILQPTDYYFQFAENYL